MDVSGRGVVGRETNVKEDVVEMGIQHPDSIVAAVQNIPVAGIASRRDESAGISRFGKKNELLSLPAGEGGLYLLVVDHIESTEPIFHVIEGRLHRMVVVEQHARQLVIGDMDDFHPLGQRRLNLLLLLEASLMIEQRIVAVIVESVEPWSFVPVSVEPAQRVAVEGRPDLHPMDVRGNGDRLLVYPVRPCLAN